MERQKRQEEIEAKRARLAELKRARELRTQELKSSRLPGDLSDSSQASHAAAERQRDIENILSSLESRPSPNRLSGSPARVGSRSSRPSSVFGSRQLSTERSDSRPRLSDGSGDKQDAQYVTTATQTTTAAAGTGTAYDSSTIVTQPAIASARVVETYDHAVQTDEYELGPDPRTKSRGDGEAEEGEEWGADGQPLSRRQKDRYEQIRQNLKKEVEDEIRAALGPGSSDGTNHAAGEDKFPARMLTTEELEAVTSSQDFMDFVDQSTKVIERALDEPYDLLTDYAEAKGALEDDEDGFGVGRSRRGRKVKEVAQYWDERWCRKRMISDIGFSPKYPELLLTAYTKNPSAPHDPSGLLLVWNSHMPSRPEYIFHSSSDILTAKFSPFHPSLLVAGCYSGQILVYDTRSKSHSPVQKTLLTGQGHTHPVYCIDIVGTQNANNIISCSTDGVVCSWSIDMLAQPQEYLELLAPPPAKSEDLAPLCIAFPAADPTYFLAGTEEGTIYTSHRYERAGAKAGVDARIRYTGHTAPVTGLDFHPARGPVDLGDLVLSSSLDWTVRLWRVRPPAATGSVSSASGAAAGSTSSATTAGGAAGSAPSSSSAQVHPVLEFPRDDLVYDAKWSPTRPGVFACVDGAGALEVWDINTDVEIPAARLVPSERTGQGGASFAKRSLNKLAWERGEGKRLAVGGVEGVVTVFEVGGELGGVEGGVKGEEWSGVKKVVQRAEARVGAVGVVNGGGNGVVR